MLPERDALSARGEGRAQTTGKANRIGTIRHAARPSPESRETDFPETVADGEKPPKAHCAPPHGRGGEGTGDAGSFPGSIFTGESKIIVYLSPDTFFVESFRHSVIARLLALLSVVVLQLDVLDHVACTAVPPVGEEPTAGQAVTGGGSAEKGDDLGFQPISRPDGGLTAIVAPTQTDGCTGIRPVGTCRPHRFLALAACRGARPCHSIYCVYRI